MKKKASPGFVDLTAAYETVWHRSLTCKLLPLLPDRHMVKMIIELVAHRSLTPTTKSDTHSRLRCFKNGVQGSVLPTSVLQKYAYADDLAFMHFAGDWQAVEPRLSDTSSILPDLACWLPSI